ncbi:MAG TPA: hypothetical protein VFK31_09675 [Rhodanobacteraceae bacterium]|nr:hypothetical protein [Rhodanobacteraceae bacterium]
MARIPLGNFDQPRVNPQPGPHVFAPGGADSVGRAAEQLGRTGQRVAAHFVEEQAQAQAQAEAKQKAEDLAMARADASHALLQYELHTQQAAKDISDQIASGQLSYKDAGDAWDKALKAIPTPQPTGLPPPLAKAFGDGLLKQSVMGRRTVDAAVTGARQAHFQAQFDAVLDTQLKLAGMPNSDPAAIIAKAEAYIPLARLAGWNEAQVDTKMQAFKDALWTGQAVQRANMGRNSISTLRDLAHDLTDKDGAYAGKLDANKRNAILLQVTNRISALRSRAENAQNRADAHGAQAINQIDRQIASGIPATPEMWTQWAAMTKGTASAAAFRQRLQEEKQVQNVLRMPPDKQAQFIQQKEAELMKGGSVQEAADVARLKRAVAANLKQLQTNPLLFNQARMGDAVKPLDLSLLETPDDTQAITDNLQDRAATIKAIRAHYGDQVPAHLLLPQEVQALQGVLQHATPEQKTALFATIHDVAGSDEIYGDLMKQLAPHDPTLAYAGMLAQRPETMTLETHWFGPDDTVDSRRVATTMVQGQAILAGKGDKAYKAPSDKDFRAQFDGKTHGLFAGRPDAARVAMQAVKAYYVGKASEDGDTSGEIDTTRLDYAIHAALGTVVDVNGNGKVLAPWGMDEDHFLDAAHQAFDQAVKADGLSADVADRWDDFGLVQRGDGTYYVVQGRNFLQGKNGPVVIDVKQPVPTVTVEDAPMFMAVNQPAGLVSPGNIDLMKRPVVQNKDGTYSTVRSITITADGKAILIPTVIGDRVVSNKAAIKHYRETGENLGVFDTERDADRYAEQLHEQQAQMYPPPAPATGDFTVTPDMMRSVR